jgi:hypothetical protein
MKNKSRSDEGWLSARISMQSRTLLAGLAVALGLMIVSLGTVEAQPVVPSVTEPATAPAVPPGAPAMAERPVKLHNYPLNRFVRLLDGQWQGTHLASDGKVYFGGSSHQPALGAAFFQYDHDTAELTMILEDITTVVNEDPAKTPPQGKIHSDIVEHEGWLYFGTHLANYTAAGLAAYTGAHLVGYQMATGKFRDFGVIHSNYTNYATVGLDTPRGKIYFYVTPFHEGEGSRLYRIDIATGEKEDFGLVAPWDNRRDHGPPAYHCFVDARGDCWLTVRGQRTLFVGRAATGTVERMEGALPISISRGDDPWRGLRAIDEDRALVVMQGGAWVFDATKANAGEPAFTQLRELGHRLTTYIALGGGRFYWVSSRGRDTSGHSLLWSAPLSDPANALCHGQIVDEAGRKLSFPGDLVTDGRGTVYMVGRWNALDDDMEDFGIIRNRQKIALFFTVIDVSADLPTASPETSVSSR